MCPNATARVHKSPFCRGLDHMSISGSAEGRTLSSRKEKMIHMNSGRRASVATFFRIALPLSKGLLGILAFFSFSAQWVNYFLPYVLLGSTSNFTLPVGLGVLFSSTPALNPGNGAEQSVIGRPEIAVPILIVFLASSRLLVRSVLAGSVKS